MTQTQETASQLDLSEQLYSLAKDLNLVKKELDNVLLKIARTEFEVLMKLALVAEYKDTDTGVHIHRIGYMAWLPLCTMSASLASLTISCKNLANMMSQNVRL